MKLWTKIYLMLTAACAAVLLSIPMETLAQGGNLVWRVQINLVTGDVKDAGTDDNVSLSLNDSNLTRLDYGRNDFERNSRFTYDLLPTDIRTLEDISRIRISKTGSDGWCLRSMELIVNGRTAYSETLNSLCLWLDNDNGHSRTYTVNQNKLRNSSPWRNYRQPFPPFSMPRDEIESRLESAIGHFLADEKLYWGHLHGRAVEVSRSNNSTISADLDLAYDVRFLPDPEVDVDVDVRIACNSGKITLTTQNVKVDVDSRWYSEILGVGLVVDLVGNLIGDLLEDALVGVQRTIDTGTNLCPGITVQQDGSIAFSLP